MILERYSVKVIFNSRAVAAGTIAERKGNYENNIRQGTGI